MKTMDYMPLEANRTHPLWTREQYNASKKFFLNIQDMEFDPQTFTRPFYPLALAKERLCFTILELENT